MIKKHVIKNLLENRSETTDILSQKLTRIIMYSRVVIGMKKIMRTMELGTQFLKQEKGV